MFNNYLKDEIEILKSELARQRLNYWELYHSHHRLLRHLKLEEKKVPDTILVTTTKSETNQ